MITKQLTPEQIQEAEKKLEKIFSSPKYGHLIYCPNNCSVLSAYIDKVDVKRCHSADDLVNKIRETIIGNNIHKLL